MGVFYLKKGFPYFTPKQKNNLLLVIVFVCCSFISMLSTNAQPFQTLKGRIIDKTSQYPIVGVTVLVYKDSIYVQGAQTNIDGYFKFDSLSIGRYKIKATYLGYEPLFVENLVLGSGKELDLPLEMQEQAISLKGAEVNAQGKFATNNEHSVVSTRSFDALETERYAGSRQDPARMALNFAGAQATDDSRNDIVVRGNSPLGILWRFEEVELLNPNHFAIAGSNGGPISMLNNKVIGRSDFMTGAFPAGFGNALSGVFDIKLRNGNSNKHERTGQFGLFGTELAAEGPLSKKTKASYLVAYRYSTLRIFETLNIKLGTSAIPQYQDLSFKFNFPMGKKGTLSVFGIGGTSNIDIVMSKFNEPQEELYGLKNRDQYFTTLMGMAGLSYKWNLNARTFSKITIAAAANSVGGTHDLIVRNPDFSVNQLIPKLDYGMKEQKYSFSWLLRKKLSNRSSLLAGVYADQFGVNYYDSLYNENTNNWENRLQAKGLYNALLVQPYIQIIHRVNPSLTLTGGVHTNYLLMNQSLSVEPRFGAKYELNKKHALSAGVGLHSRMQALYTYFTTPMDPSGNIGMHNKSMGFTRSLHYVFTHEMTLSKTLRVKSELYYQYLFDIPVEKYASSSFSLINMGSGFERYFPAVLENKGTGRNFGIETTIEKSFSKNYFFLLTASVFDSKYKGSDGIRRNTDFNGVYSTRVLFGYEKPLDTKEKLHLISGFGFSYAGGRRYTPADRDSSLKMTELVLLDSMRNTLQFKDYIRLDLRIGLKYEGKKTSHELVIDILNLLNRQNVLMLNFDSERAIYAPGSDPLVLQPQLGRLPVFFYKIHF